MEDRDDADVVITEPAGTPIARGGSVNLGNNLSWLRCFAVTLLKHHPANDSLRGKVIRCLMNTAFLAEILTLQRH
jgi:hypothetical protein